MRRGEYGVLRFFHKQLNDDVGEYAVSLQQLLIAAISLSVIGRVLYFIFCIMAKYWGWIFFIEFVAWIFMVCGFLGAVFRSKPLVMLYLVLVVMWIGFRAVFLPWSVVRLFNLAFCDQDTCHSYIGHANIRFGLSMNIIEFVFTYVVCILLIYSFALAYKLHKLLRERGDLLLRERAPLIQPQSQQHPQIPASFQQPIHQEEIPV